MADRVEAGDSLDYFPSPPWWGRSVGVLLDQFGLPRGRLCEEPAAGEGHLAHGLADVFARVKASDIHPYPRRAGAMRIWRQDYLHPGRAPSTYAPGWPEGADWVVTNPPFGDRTEAFIRRGVARARIGAAMLLQLRLLEGVGRYRLFHECGLYGVGVLPRRGSGLRKGLWQPGLSTATTYAWFVFVRPGAVEGWAGFDGEVRLHLFDPRSADLLTRPSDQAFAGLS